MVLGDDLGGLASDVFELYFSNLNSLVVGVYLLLNEPQLVVVEKHQPAVVLKMRKVALAFRDLFLDKIAKHKDRCDWVLVNHFPEIFEGGGERSLGGDNSSALHRDEVGIDVVLDCFILRGRVEADPSGLEGEVGRVAVEVVLLRVFVELVDVLLGLGHVGKDFELGAQAALHLLEAEGNLGYGGAHLLEVFVLVHPLLRNVIALHL